MLERTKIFSFFTFIMLALFTAGCKKGEFDINSPNPNLPSNVDSKFLLSGALSNTAALVRGGYTPAYYNPTGEVGAGNGIGDPDFAELYMGYWSVSAEYNPVAQTLTYQTTTDYFSDNWNSGYLIVKNFDNIQNQSDGNSNQSLYLGIAMIMKAFIYQRIVDLYNNAPYYQAVEGETIDFPTYDSASAIYVSLINQLDSAIAVLSSAPTTAENPGNYDIMFGGNMQEWKQFANTVKLKIALNLTQYSAGTALIQKALSGLVPGNFLGSGEDAAINPGYSNSSNIQQSPFYQDMGYNTSGAAQNNNNYFRACSYAVNYMYKTNDTIRLYQIYAPNEYGVVEGRPFGSNVLVGQENNNISGMGPGLLKTPMSSAVILPACESLLMQAEALQRGYIAGDGSTVASLYQAGVLASFNLLEDPNAMADAAAYLAGTADPDATNLSTIIMQEWLSLNGFDPVHTWNNWRRLGIPADLPVSEFEGTTATHIPYRLLYPTSEYAFNTVNVNAQGVINNLTSKIFWMP
jgi:Starch-binding associating with outer membrane